MQFDEDGTMKAFSGEDAPVGLKCQWCEETIVYGDCGWAIPVLSTDPVEPLVPDVGAYHRECFIRSTCGSVGHINKRCSCYGGDEEDPPNMTRREAARAATELLERMRDLDDQ